MSKILYILRHAQSVGKQTHQRDYDRALTVSGASFAKYLGVKLKKLGILPDYVLASAAVRAQETFTQVNESLRIPNEKLHFTEDLYEPTVARCTLMIHGIPDNINSVLLVGHNPWLSVLVSNLASRTLDLVPCEFIGLEFPVSEWKMTAHHGKIILHIKPDQP